MRRPTATCSHYAAQFTALVERAAHATTVR